MASYSYLAIMLLPGDRKELDRLCDQLYNNDITLEDILCKVGEARVNKKMGKKKATVLSAEISNKDISADISEARVSKKRKASHAVLNNEVDIIHHKKKASILFRNDTDLMTENQLLKRRLDAYGNSDKPFHYVAMIIICLSLIFIEKKSAVECYSESSETQIEVQKHAVYMYM